MSVYWSGAKQDSDGASEGSAWSRGRSSLFVGSFNINSQDLTQEDAKRWLQHAADADIVALGLQECAVVPAKPFPSPTNGKAVSMWRDAQKAMLQRVSPEPVAHNMSDTTSAATMADEEGTHLRSPSALAGLVQAVVDNKKSSGNHNVFHVLPPLNVTKTADQQVPSPESLEAGLEKEAPLLCLHPSASGTSEEDNPDSPSTSMDGSDQGLVNRRQMFSGKNEDGSTGMRQESYYLRGVVEAERDESLLRTISDCIPGRELVADVAMGETPTYGKIEVKMSPSRPRPASMHMGADETPMMLGHAQRAASTSNLGGTNLLVNTMGAANVVATHNDRHTPESSDGGAEDVSAAAKSKAVEWYGTIRLLVFVRKEVYKDLNVKTVVIPSGDKPSVVADAPEDYAKDTSPDKGAVACHLQGHSQNGKCPLDLLLVNCHLYGTNKYGVPEAVFDKYRMSQLTATDKAIRATLPSTATDRMVLFGDLNFRVEKKTGEKDKTRAGNDFQAVVKVAQDGGARDLMTLYREADRLRPLLLPRGERGEQPQHSREGPNDKGQAGELNGEMPGLLAGLEDGLGVALSRGEAIRPTFTFEPGAQTPRRYNDKRTPSWTDRILWRGFSPSEDDRREKLLPPPPSSQAAFASVPAVIVSDHEPVYCLLEL